MFAKIDVNGRNAHPLYRFLRQRKPGILGNFGLDGIRWNFTKFLIDREGSVAGRFGSATPPRALAAKIEALLDARTQA
jgi:glutathione peroxidase